MSTESATNNASKSQNSNAMLVPSNNNIDENSNGPPPIQSQAALASSIRNGNTKSFFGEVKIDPMRGLNKEEEFREIGEMVVRSSVSEAESKKANLE